jgi:hypothetical protein
MTRADGAKGRRGGLIPGIHVLAAIKQESRGWPGQTRPERKPALKASRKPIKLPVLVKGAIARLYLTATDINPAPL